MNYCFIYARIYCIYIYIHSINGSFQNVDFGICRIYVDIFRYSVYYQQTAFEDCFQEESWICVIYCFEYIYISVCVHIVIYIYIYIHMGFYIVYYIGNTHTHTYVYIYIYADAAMIMPECLWPPRRQCRSAWKAEGEVLIQASFLKPQMWYFNLFHSFWLIPTLL